MADGAPPSDVIPATLRGLVGLAWPVVLARSTQAVIGFCDALMIAPLGERALAATTTGATNAFTLAILPMGLVFIVQSFAAQLHGRGDLVAARRYAWYGLGLAALTTVVSVALLPLVAPILGTLSYEPEVRRLMGEYLAIRMLAIGAVVGSETLGNWFGGLGNTRLHMLAGVLSMVVNIGLNWVLIFGHLGAPALGVVGAALASAIAGWLGFGFLALCFARYGPGRAPRLGLRWSELGRMVRFGLPNGLSWFVEFAAFSLFLNVVVAHLGTVVLAALNVVLQLNAVAFMPAFGVSSAGAILVGQAVGRGARDQVWPIVRLTGSITLVWQGLVGLTYLAMPALLMGWFAPAGDKGPELVRIGATMLALSVAWQLFDAVQMTFAEALRAAGDTAWCMWIRMGLAWLLFVPVAALLVLVLDHGHVAIMLCLIGYLALSAVALAWRFASGRWRGIDLTGVDPLVP